MAIRASYEHLTEIGCFATVTNSFAIVGQTTSVNFFSVVEKLLSGNVPVIHATIGGTNLVGNCTVGNRHGLLVSSMCTDQELRELRNALPSHVKVARVDDRLSALGNVITCNDYVALVHTDLDSETKEIIQSVLKVEVFPTMIGGNPLVGSNILFTNRGGLVSPRVSMADLEELAQLTQVPLTAGTINNGNLGVASGLLANDFAALVGQDTTGVEIQVVDKMFGLSGDRRTTDGGETTMRTSLIDSLL